MVESTEHPDHAGHSAHAADIAVEQAYVDELFARIDADVVAANERLRDVMLRVDRATPDPEALVEREVEYHALNDKLDTLTVAQLGLVFGRITHPNTTTAPSSQTGVRPWPGRSTLPPPPTPKV